MPKQPTFGDANYCRNCGAAVPLDAKYCHTAVNRSRRMLHMNIVIILRELLNFLLRIILPL